MSNPAVEGDVCCGADGFLLSGDGLANLFWWVAIPRAFLLPVSLPHTALRHVPGHSHDGERLRGHSVVLYCLRGCLENGDPGNVKKPSS